MDIGALASFLALGFGLGIIHAFDPDHLAAVGGLSASTHKHQRNWHFALQWSFGHGAALLFIALSVFFVGLAIPETLSQYAERSVAFMLVAIGTVGVYRLYRNNPKTNRAFTAAPIVGLVHGTAGSAPLLALIPLSQLSQPIIGVWYVLCFSGGVVLAMASIGSLLSLSLGYLIRQNAPLVGVIQTLLAIFSILLGVYLMLAA